MNAFGAHEQYRLTRVEHPTRDPDGANPDPVERALDTSFAHGPHPTPTRCSRIMHAANPQPGAVSGVGKRNRRSYTSRRDEFKACGDVAPNRIAAAQRTRSTCHR